MMTEVKNSIGLEDKDISQEVKIKRKRKEMQLRRNHRTLQDYLGDPKSKQQEFLKERTQKIEERHFLMKLS